MGENRCHNFTEKQQDVIFYTRIGAASVAFAVCLLTLVALFVLVCCLRVWKTFVHRLKLHLTAVATILSVLYLLQVLPMKAENHHSWNNSCKPIAFFLQYFDWLMLLIICWIVIYLYRLARDIGKPSQEQQRPWWFEATGTLATFTLPLLIVWIPFATHNAFGVDGKRWCEGIVIVHHCGDTRYRSEGLGLLLGLWYLPTAIVALACIVCIILALAHFWKFYKQQGLTHQMNQAIVKGIPIIIYLILYNSISCIDISSYVYHTSRGKNWHLKIDYGLWLTHAITGPGRAMIVPFAFVLSQFLIQCCFRNQRMKHRDSYTSLND